MTSSTVLENGQNIENKSEAISLVMLAKAMDNFAPEEGVTEETRGLRHLIFN